MNKKLIYDLGLHTGQDTEFYLKKGFNVVAIEANPILIREAEQYFASEVDSGQLKLLNVGIGKERGKFPFYVHKEHSHWSSFDFDIGTQRGDYEIIEVEMIPLDEVLTEFGTPYYLKIDIEGMDFIALQSLRKFADRPMYVSAENGPPEMLREMVELGYSRFKFINQQTVSNIELPEPAREGSQITWSFPFGASGPFGEETIGEWLEEGAALELIKSYWGNPTLDPNIHGWFDLHAKFQDK